MIVRGGNTSTFSYGAEQQRTRQLRSDGTTIWYAGAMEIEETASVVTVKTYWPGGIGFERQRSGEAAQLLWTHTDLQGSVLGLTGGDGTWLEKLDYDAWGKRRTLNGLSTPDNLDGTLDNKGYTGHEMLDGLDLVHMNGRIYDPRIARFVSADPIVQAPDNGQSWNRYSYVWNSPTNFTDPTGLVVVRADVNQTAKEAVPFGADEFTRDTSADNGAGTSGANPGAVNSAQQQAKNPQAVVQSWIDNAVDKAGSGMLVAAIGAAATAANQMVVPESAVDAISVGPLKVLKKAEKLKDLAKVVEDVVKAEDKVHDAAKGAGKVVPDSTIVCRGGSCTADAFKNGSGVTTDAAGKLSGISTGVGNNRGQTTVFFRASRTLTGG